ncbi:MAG: GspE/PulE family protein [bacterium]
MIQFDEDKQNKKIKDLYSTEEEELAQMLAARYGLLYVNFAQIPINSDALRVIEEAKARAAKCVAYNRVDKRLEIAVLSPKNDATVALIGELEQKGYKVSQAMASINSLTRAWEMYKDLSFASETKAGSLEVSSEEIADMLVKVRTVEDVKKLVADILSQNKGFRISKIFEIILAGALATGASDVHLEPEENAVRLRLRLDGVLHNVLSLDHETYHLLLSRVKLLSGMKLNIKNNAQDGRLSVKLNESEIEIRVSILPGSYSESIVMRILNPKSIAVPLESMGIDPKLFAILQKEIDRPEGMILTTGPTGSGKTTTLYAFLRKVSQPEIKIITIEDPIEYHLPGIVQTQVESEKGYDFLNGLRAALRQDPDIIMVGEIRDSETANIAINSAQTGHLVFSTLHTNSAAGTFPRLIDLGVNPKTLTSAVNIALAQRLVRVLCPSCKKQVPLDAENAILVAKTVAGIADASYREALTKDGIDVAKQWLPVGCDKCNMTGYKGRIGIYEGILRSEAVEAAVIANPSEREIKKAALAQGLLDMRQDGVLKMLRGVTSLDELSRVIDLFDEF